jgi:hypothetical protein
LFCPIPDGVAVRDLEYTVSASGVISLFAAVETPNAADVQNGGIWQSNDNGLSWSRLLGGLPPSNVGRTALVADHSPGHQLVYAAMLNWNDDSFDNVFKTADNGGSWVATNVPSPSPNQGWYDLALGLSPSGRVYLGGQTYAGTRQYGVWESNPGATQWRQIEVGNSSVVPHGDHHAFAFGADGTVYLDCNRFS